MPKNPYDLNDSDSAFGLATHTKDEVTEPSMYKVLLHNDDYTPMDFVVEVLELVFSKEKQDANQIMMDVHEKGVGVCGIYPRDIAETKSIKVKEMAESEQHPLRCSIEKE